MRDLTANEVDVLRHMCEHAWVDDSVVLDRAKLAAQIDHLTAQPGCDVEGCPCLDFAFRGETTWRDDFRSDAAGGEGQTVLVMDIKDSPWQANLFVSGGIIAWLEFSSFGEDYPTRMPDVGDLH